MAAHNYIEILERSGLAKLAPGALEAHTPIDGARLASIAAQTTADIDTAVGRAQAAFRTWRATPAPRRGELVRLFGEELRAALHEFAQTDRSRRLLQQTTAALEGGL